MPRTASATSSPKAKDKKKPVEGLSYEEAFAELDAVVTALEAEQLPLEQSMAMFERGQALIKRCAQLLEQAELRVRSLNGQEPDEPGE